MQRLSSTEESTDRQPQAPSAASSSSNRPSKAGQIKNAMVSKFS